MPIIRSEYDFRRSTEVALAEVDISTRDVVGRLSTDAKAAPCGAGEMPMFVFADEAEADAPVSVVWLASGGRMALRIHGVVLAGAKLKADADGFIIASATNESAEPAAGDFAIATESGGVGDYLECIIL